MRFKNLSFLLSFLLVIMLALVACDAAGIPSRAPSPETDAPSPTPTEPADPPSEVPPPDGEPGNPKIEPGQLTAGEWRDLNNWDFWLELMNKEEWSPKQDYWGFYPEEKISVVVTNAGKSVIDAGVTLTDKDDNVLWESKTDNQGRADLFPQLFDTAPAPYKLSVTSGKTTVTLEDAQVNSEQPLALELASTLTPDTLDLMFVIDTTGSMSDELRYLAAELQDVMTRVEKNASNLTFRLSANFYRDVNDAYTVRSFPFTSDVATVVKQMSEQRANGGGDYPEAVELALEDAIEEHEWSSEAKARLLFLVLDAPPHHSQKIVSKVQTLAKAAAKQGIRIIPLASSGVDKDTEFLMRFLSISTGATYTFLTNDSGIGNEKIEPTVGEYQVDLLNDLLVRVISEYVQ